MKNIRAEIRRVVVLDTFEHMMDYVGRDIYMIFGGVTARRVRRATEHDTNNKVFVVLMAQKAFNY